MSSQSLVEQLNNQINRFETDRAAILADKRFTPQHQQKQLDALRDSSQDAVLRTATDLWGQIEQNQTADGSYQLSDNGTAWRELASAGKRIAAAQEAAQAVDTAAVQYAMLRVQSLANDAQRSTVPLQRLEQEYEQGTQSIRVAMQDLAGLIITEQTPAAAMFRGQLERDRAARVNTPEVQTAYTAQDRLIETLVAGYEVTQRAARLFWPDFDPSNANYAARVLDAVKVNREYVNEGIRQGFKVSLTKKQWGVRWHGSSVTPIFSGSPQWKNA